MLKVGLILYSVRGEMEKDPIGTVEKVAWMGYKYLEVCNHNAINDPGCGFGVDAPTLKRAFDEKSAQVISAHVFPFEKSDMQAVIRYNQTLGNHNIVNPMGKFSTYDDLRSEPARLFISISSVSVSSRRNGCLRAENFRSRRSRPKAAFRAIRPFTEPFGSITAKRRENTEKNSKSDKYRRILL